MAIRSKDEIVQNIVEDLPDNNAGLISAADVRENMRDIVDSIVAIVASGDFTSRPFRNGIVRFAKGPPGDEFSGIVSVESGVVFPIGGLQTIAYPGPNSINHNQLASLTVGDPHPQYINTSGTRVMIRNLGLGNSWINSSGNSTVESTNNRGLSFEYTNQNVETITVGNKSIIKFGNDNSVMSTAKGVAKAWLNFDASVNPPVIRSYYNIHQLQKISEGKYRVFFTSGVFADNNYIAIGSSNARSSSNAPEDFDVNSVGVTLRQGNDTTSLRNITFSILNDGGQFVDAEINELVVYGRSPGEGSGIPPTVTVL